MASFRKTLLLCGLLCKPPSLQGHIASQTWATQRRNYRQLLSSFISSRCASYVPAQQCTHKVTYNQELRVPSIAQVRQYSDKRRCDLSYEDLTALLQSGDIQLFDVREPKEITETGLIPTATNVPLGQIKEALLMKDSQFIQRYGSQKPLKNDTNIVYYGLGGELGPIRSNAAVEISQKLGFKKARHYVGGWEEWAARHQR